MIYVLDGLLRLRVAGEDVVVGDGEVVRVSPEAPRQIEALADTFALAVRGGNPASCRDRRGRRRVVKAVGRGAPGRASGCDEAHGRRGGAGGQWTVPSRSSRPGRTRNLRRRRPIFHCR